MKKVLLVLCISFLFSPVFADELQILDENLTVPEVPTLDLNKRSIEPGELVWYNDLGDYDDTWFDKNGYIFPHKYPKDSMNMNVNMSIMSVGNLVEISEQSVVIYDGYFYLEFDQDHIKIIPQQSTILIAPYPRPDFKLNLGKKCFHQGDLVAFNGHEGIFDSCNFDKNGFILPEVMEKELILGKLSNLNDQWAEILWLRRGIPVKLSVLQVIPQQSAILLNW